MQKFIDKNRPALAEHRLKWPEQCRDGTVM
jgi:hypothetical protein